MSQEEFNIQEGSTDLEHRNIDQAGDDHPFGNDPKEFEASLRSLIRRVADELYESWEATLREYLANAETATLRVEEYVNTGSTSMINTDLIVEDSYQPKIEVEWNKKENKIIIQDNGIGMSAEVVDKVFRQIGKTTSRDDGRYSGNFGQGVLSFVKLVGVDNAMIMTSHSRINDDNASYYVTLAGVEPIRGSLPEDQYGTKFQLTPKSDFDIREAIATYSEWMRVPVRYEEIGDSGEIVFQEDYGNKSFFDSYSNNSICLGVKENQAFEAYCSPDANGETLLLSMQIDRNDSSGRSSNQYSAPFPFDVRLLDESGKVVESSNGNEGLMSAVRSDYESMLKQARDPYITEYHCNNDDVIGQKVESGPNEGSVVVSSDALSAGKPIPSKYDYITRSEVSESDSPGETIVLIGPNQGKTVIDEEEWNSLDEGRAAKYIPEDELEEYDIESGEGDLCLPEPTSDRDRLQSNKTFWKYVAEQFGKQFDTKVEEICSMIDGADDSVQAVMDMDPEDMVVNPEGFAE